MRRTEPLIPPRPSCSTRSLPETLQDEIAERLVDDIHGEEQWDETLARSADALEKLADRALADYRAGRTEKMGFDER